MGWWLGCSVAFHLHSRLTTKTYPLRLSTHSPKWDVLVLLQQHQTHIMHKELVLFFLHPFNIHSKHHTFWCQNLDVETQRTFSFGDLDTCLYRHAIFLLFLSSVWYGTLPQVIASLVTITPKRQAAVGPPSPTTLHNNKSNKNSKDNNNNHDNDHHHHH